MVFQEFQTMVNCAVALSWDIWVVYIYHLIADSHIWTELIISAMGVFPILGGFLVVICLILWPIWLITAIDNRSGETAMSDINIKIYFLLKDS